MYAIWFDEDRSVVSSVALTNYATSKRVADWIKAHASWRFRLCTIASGGRRFKRINFFFFVCVFFVFGSVQDQQLGLCVYLHCCYKRAVCAGNRISTFWRTDDEKNRYGIVWNTTISGIIILNSWVCNWT